MKINFSTEHKSLETLVQLEYGADLLRLCIEIEAWGRSNIRPKGIKGKQRYRYVYSLPSAYAYEEAAKIWMDEVHAARVAAVLYYGSNKPYHLEENSPILQAYQREAKKQMSANKGAWVSKNFVESLAIAELLKEVTIADDHHLDNLDASVFL